MGKKVENSIHITFLDIIIKLDHKGKLEYEFYQKPTASGRYLHFKSHNPIKTKINIVRTETHRRINNCKYIKDVYKHLDTLKSQLLKCQYPKNIH